MAEDTAAIEDKAPDEDMNIVSGLLVAHVEEVRSHIDEEHNAWALKMWCRMDRDGNGFINRAELDREEFRGIIRSVLAPEMGAVMGGVEYMRSELNMSQAINYCLRKADLNRDNVLSFAEFNSFLRVLKNQDLGKSTAHLIFALFDLDQDTFIDELEFREVFRFFLGHKPTEEQFQNEWAKLDRCGEQKVDLAKYIEWLQTSTNPIFHQHAPPAPPIRAPDEGVVADDGRYLPRLKPPADTKIRPKWNQRFNAGVNRNEKCPQGQRSYFSKAQSLPELKRFYETRRGFRSMASLMQLPEVRPKPAVLSNERTGDICLPRSVPGTRDGWMRNHITGRQELWTDHWQAPKCIQQFYQPGTVQLRCPGEPPRWMFERGEDDTL